MRGRGGGRTVASMLSSAPPAPRRPRPRPRHAVTLLALGAVAALPGAAAAATPAFELKVAMPSPEATLGELVLSARCATACTVTLRDLNVLRYKGGEQLPHAGSGPLTGTRRLPAGKTVAIRFTAPAAVRHVAMASLPRGEALFGNVVVNITPAGGAPVDAVRQFTVTTAGTAAPFPPMPTVDAIKVPKAPRAGARRKARYAMTLAGTQTSRWSYDRTEQRGGCRIVDAGRGAQTLRFRSTRAVTVQELVWRTGDMALNQIGTPFSGVFIPVRIDAERDGGAQKGATGDCGLYGGERDGPAPACVRSGSRDIHFIIGFLSGRRGLDASTTPSSFDTPTERPDCPIEVAEGLRDPLDLLDGPPVRGGWLANGGSPGKVLAVYQKRDTTRLKGGTVTTVMRLTVTFRKLRG